MKQVISLESATRHLKQLFTDPSKDILTVEEVYRAGNKTPGNKRDAWFKNTSLYLRQHGLIESQIKKINGLSILVGIALTEKGKIALGSSAEQYLEHKTIEKSTPSHMDVVYLLTTLSKEIPTRKIIYNIAENTITIH